MRTYLAPTYFIDSDHPKVIEFSETHSAGLENPVEIAVALYYAVRDGFRYNPYEVVLREEAMKASYLLTKTSGYCTEKAILLAASLRHKGIPARLGFSDVRNHIGTEKLQEHLKTDVLVFHGYTDIWLEGKWVKATPAFNASLCEKLGVAPLEFNGKEDSVFQEFNNDSNLFMEYLHNHGTFDDMPFDRFVEILKLNYPHIFIK